MPTLHGHKSRITKVGKVVIMNTHHHFNCFINNFLRNTFSSEMRDHDNHCDLIENDPSGNMSKEYGINCRSALNGLKYFHVCNGVLIPDVMHDVLEGVLQYEAKLMLQCMINVENYFSIDICLIQNYNMLNLAILNQRIGLLQYH